MRELQQLQIPPELLQFLPVGSQLNVALPPLESFLPSLDGYAELPAFSEFLNKTGLPTWEEAGLPPLAELLKPLGPQKAAPPLQQFLATMNLPPGLAPLIAALPPINLPPISDLAKLLPPLGDLVKILPPMQGTVNIPTIGAVDLNSLPALPFKLPPLADILNALPKIDNLNLASIAEFLGKVLPPLSELAKLLPAPAATTSG